MRINSNISSMKAQESAINTNNKLLSSLESLSSGLKINKAADDASGLSIADKLRTQASSLKQSISNGTSASAMIQIADKAMSEQSNILDIMKQKMIQASTSTTSDDGRESIRKDVVKLLTQLDNIASQTNYNGTTLLQNSSEFSESGILKANNLSFQMGEDKDFDIDLSSNEATNSFNLGGGDDILNDYFKNSTTHNFYGVQDNEAFNFQTSKSLWLSFGESDPSIHTSATDLDNSAVISGVIENIYAHKDVYLDVSNDSQNMKNIMFIISQEHAGLIDNGNNNYTLKENENLKLTDLDFSALQVSLHTVGGSFSLNTNNSDIDFNVRANLGEFNKVTDTKHILNVAKIIGNVVKGGPILHNIYNIKANEFDIKSANSFMGPIDSSISQLNTTRSDFASAQNQIESSLRNLQTTHTNLKSAESTIRDVNYASESANFNKQNIIAQANTYALSQANSISQNVMRLLQ